MLANGLTKEQLASDIKDKLYKLVQRTDSIAKALNSVQREIAWHSNVLEGPTPNWVRWKIKALQYELEATVGEIDYNIRTTFEEMDGYKNDG